jgi:kynurenine formamidase
MVTRGVLLDMAAHYNTDVVKEGTAFNVKEIEEVAKKQGVEIRQGDVVIFHTGWLSLIGKDDKRFGAGEPGLGVEGAKYLTGKGVVALVPTPGASKRSRSRPRTSSRCTRYCCR